MSNAAEDYEKLVNAYKELNECVVSVQNRTGVFEEDGCVGVDEAIDLLDDSPELKEFQKRYPNIDYTKVARMDSSSTDLKEALGEASKIKDMIDESEEQRASNSNVDLITKIADNQHDILNMTDDSVDKLEKILAEGAEEF
jgi:hypothetical protein